jgi:hypothetical protein
LTRPVTPAIDKRDGYRARVDAAVHDFGVNGYGWTAQQVLKAKRVCYRTIFAETNFRNLANPSVPESLLVIPNDGIGTDLNSTGLYQQRAQFWGSVVGSMDPYTATMRFLKAMVHDVPAWFTTTESTVCQLVQRSQFDSITIDLRTGKPFPFAQNYIDREPQTNALALDELYFQHGGA